ncbi:DUF3558 family protein [Amycolatopsis taiwanensis]|uniref:DUF3558 domain-containing protein n=1 Tax=Amycolatopsis taiwanensis TaxID=342230 RepID=A0A9W6QWL7_9PSEU|nr:DUF3558 family protein [Amycolatopsis taiwanensis]GLY64006.1 hypothetical protein Atai01_06250 [Amycolatopsis taiwanensis]
MRSTATLTTLIAAAALVVTACTSTQTGQASPTSEQSAAPSAGASSTDTATNRLAGLNACTLLTDAEAQQVVPGAGAHTDQGEIGGPGTSNCRWVTPAASSQGSVVFGVTVRPAQSITEVKPNPNRPDSTVSNTTTTGGRRVVVLRNSQGQGSCQVSIEAGSGRVDIDTEVVPGTTDAAFEVDSKLSDYIEPRLPSS